MPPNAQFFIKQVRNLAFFEFLTDWIFAWLDEKFKNCNEEDSCSNIFVRIGQNKLFRNSGVMAVAAGCLVITSVGLGALYLIGKKSSKVISIAKEIKKAMFWNTFIRYVLQSTLKLQMSAVSVLYIATVIGNSQTKNVRLL